MRQTMRDESSRQPPLTDISDRHLSFLTRAAVVFCVLMLAIGFLGQLIQSNWPIQH